MVGALLLAHLNRLAGWAIGSILVGGWLASRPNPGLKAAGVMSVAWAAINLIIAFASRGGTATSALSSTREFLAFNLGLNFAYIGVGIALLVLGNAVVRANGVAVAIQGLGLLALDGFLYWQLVKMASR